MRRAALILLLLLLLICLAAGLWLWQGRSVLYSDPAAPRKNPSYERLFQAPSLVPPLSSNVLAQLDNRTTRDSTLRFPFNVKLPDAEFLPVQQHRADSNHQARIGSGLMRLDLISVGYTVPPSNILYSIQVPGRHFAPDGRELLLPEASKTHNFQEKLTFRGDFPSAQFYFTASNFARTRTLSFAAFDARTRRSLTSGHSSSSAHIPLGRSNGLQRAQLNFGCDVRLWHQTPIELVCTFATGPVQSFEMPAVEGAVLSYPAGLSKLLVITNRPVVGWGNESSGSTNVLLIQMEEASEQPANPPKTKATYVFFVWPRASIAPIDLELLGADGEVLEMPSNSSSEHLRIISGEVEPPAVRTVRLKYYPEIHRVVFRLPELPGLPEENRNLKNLFDTHVPAIRFPYEHDFRDDLGQLIAMDVPPMPLSYPNGYFPFAREKTTPRALFEELLRYRINPDDYLFVDPEKNAVTLEKSPLVRLFERLRKVIPGQ